MLMARKRQCSHGTRDECVHCLQDWYPFHTCSPVENRFMAREGHRQRFHLAMQSYRTYTREWCDLQVT